MSRILNGLLLAGTLAWPASGPAAEPPLSKAAQARAQWVKQDPGYQREKQQICDLAKNYESAASPQERQPLKKQLREKVETYYTLRDRNRQETIRRLEAQLTELKKKEEDCMAHRQSLVESLMVQLTGDKKINAPPPRR